MKRTYLLIILPVVLALSSCGSSEDHIVYESNDLKITWLTTNSFIHTSYLETEDFGRVGCNGLVYIDGDEALVMDTPADKKASLELISWLKKEKSCKIKGVVATHFHEDCIRGLKEFHDEGAMSFANVMSRDLMLDAGGSPILPKYCFEDELTIEVGGQKVLCSYLGAGHTEDNIVCYLPSESVLFGGCLVKALEAGKGFTGDSNLNEWSSTVSKVKRNFTDAQFIVPGHGETGDKQLLDYTIEMFAADAQVASR